MNWKRFWLTALLVFIGFEITNIVIHGFLMMGIYNSEPVKSAFRPEEMMNRYMWVMHVTGLVYCFFFTFFFVKGYENKGLVEGIRFGFYVGLFYTYVSTFNEFVLFSIPYSLAWYWILEGVVQSILLGLLAAAIYRPKQVVEATVIGEAA